MSSWKGFQDLHVNRNMLAVPHLPSERTAPFRGTKVALKTERRFLFLMDKPKNQSRRCSRAPHRSRARGRERSASRRVHLAPEKHATTPRTGRSRVGASLSEGTGEGQRQKVGRGLGTGPLGG